MEWEMIYIFGFLGGLLYVGIAALIFKIDDLIKKQNKEEK